MSYEVIHADAITALESIQEGAIQTTVTSPPYFGLRNYSEGNHLEVGTESSVAEYVARLSDIMEQLLRKTSDDGTLFVNLGDSYVNGELAGVPWRVALALKDVGWRLRADIIWRKPNAMPSSVKDRPTIDHEYVFMFAKSKKYLYNQDAIREPHVTFSEDSKMKGGRGHFGKRGGTPEQGKNGGNSNLHDARWDQAFHPKGRNKRTVWDIPLSKFPGAHFAVFPEKLVETCLLAGSNQGDLVFDPFTGSGTTGIVARKNGRHFVGAELVAEYAQMAQGRIDDVAPALFV